METSLCPWISADHLGRHAKTHKICLGTQSQTCECPALDPDTELQQRPVMSSTHSERDAHQERCSCQASAAILYQVPRLACRGGNVVEPAAQWSNCQGTCRGTWSVEHGATVTKPVMEPSAGSQQKPCLATQSLQRTWYACCSMSLDGE